jgi:hypothetical protein
MRSLITILALLFCLGTAQAQEAFVLQPPETGVKGSYNLAYTHPGMNMLWLVVAGEGGEGFETTYGSLDSFILYPENKAVYLRSWNTSVLLSLQDRDLKTFHDCVPHPESNQRPFFYAWRSGDAGTLNVWLFCQ